MGSFAAVANVEVQSSSKFKVLGLWRRLLQEDKKTVDISRDGEEKEQGCCKQDKQ